jgi:hypothetical protein
MEDRARKRDPDRRSWPPQPRRRDDELGSLPPAGSVAGRHDSRREEGQPSPGGELDWSIPPAPKERWAAAMKAEREAEARRVSLDGYVRAYSWSRH